MLKAFVIFVLLHGAMVTLSCNNDSLLSLHESAGAIVGVVKPDSVNATVVALQVEEKARTETGPGGQFALRNLLNGIYTVEITAPGFSKSVLNGVRVFERGTTTVGEIQLSQRPSQITSTLPEHGQLDVAMHSAVRFYFNEQMDRERVEQAFSIQPNVAGDFQWSSSARSSFFEFRPTPRFRPRTEYAVRLAKDALTATGDSLELAYNVVFITQAVVATVVFPRDGDIFVRPRTTINLSFNTFMDLESVESAFLTEPQIVGAFQWSTLDRPTFVPSRSLFTDTEYVIALTTSAVDFEGVALENRLELSFRTEPLRIESHSPNDRQTFVSPDIDIRISFNADMNQGSVESAFSTSPPATGEFQWSSGSTVRFVPTTALDANTIYEIRLEPSALDLGGKGLRNPFRFSFTTRP